MTQFRGLIFAALAASLLAACVSTGTQPYGAGDSSLRPNAVRQATP
jgi:hypothetical protein